MYHQINLPRVTLWVMESTNPLALADGAHGGGRGGMVLNAAFDACPEKGDVVGRCCAHAQQLQRIPVDRRRGSVVGHRMGLGRIICRRQEQYKHSDLV